MIAIDATTKSATINGSRKNESPNPIEPINNPIAIPMIGKCACILLQFPD